jgi:hypothetical protein
MYQCMTTRRRAGRVDCVLSEAGMPPAVGGYSARPRDSRAVAGLVSKKGLVWCAKALKVWCACVLVSLRVPVVHPMLVS